MPRLTDAEGLTDLQRDILRTVREFTDDQIIPAAGGLDRSDTYPDQIVAGNTRSNGSTATSRCCSSARARPRSRK